MRTLLIGIGMILFVNFSSFCQDDLRSTIKELMPNTYSQIAQKAAKEWSSDFEMQKYVIKKQCIALMDLVKLMQNVDIPNNVFNDIMLATCREWCQGDPIKCKEKYQNYKGKVYDDFLSCLNGDWEMIVYVLNKQIQAYKDLQ